MVLRILLWVMLILAAANWVLLTLELVLGFSHNWRTLGLAVGGSLAAVALADRVKPWVKS